MEIIIKVNVVWVNQLEKRKKENLITHQNISSVKIRSCLHFTVKFTFHHLGVYKEKKITWLENIFPCLILVVHFSFLDYYFFIWICKAARKCGINYRGNHLLFYHFLLLPAKIKMGISMFRGLNVRHDSNSIGKKASQRNLSTHIEKAAKFRYYLFRFPHSSI